MLNPHQIHDIYNADFKFGEVEQINKLVSEFLQFALVPKLGKTPTNVNKLVDSVCLLIEPYPRKQNVSIVEDLTKNISHGALDAEQSRRHRNRY